MDPDMRRQRAGRVADDQLAAHAEVGKQCIVSDRQPQVLAAAPGRGDAAPSQGGREVIRAREVPAQSAGMKRFNRLDRAANHMLVEAPPYDLDFRKLRHA
jgi:hypothetical protein